MNPVAPALLLALVALQSPPVVAEPEVTETRCGYMVDHNGRVESQMPPDLHVLQDTAREGPYAPAVPAGASIQCGRSDIIPAENDWKVLAGGRPFYIVEVTDRPNPRLAVLELVEGQVSFRFIEGRLTEAEVPRIQARLDAFQLQLRR